MRLSRTFGRIGVGAALILTLLAPAAASSQTVGYDDHQALTARLRSLTEGSGIARLVSIGTSAQGRELWVVEIAGDGVDPDTRPGLLVVANLEGDHLVGSAIAAGIVEYLTSHADEPGVAEALAERVFYVLPRLNPDGAEAAFATVRSDHRGNAVPYDDDNDGRVDEDPSEDLNGDGLITLMRVADPDGELIIDPDEPRLMKHADAAKGESGGYSVYWEGVDSDGDEFFNEDGLGGADLNRNFQHAYPYWQADAGVHMVSEAESRALMDFVVAHGNIAAILTFGHSDNLVSPPDGQGNLVGANSLALSGFADASYAGVFDVGVVPQPSGFGGGFGGFGGGGGGLPRLRGAQRGRDNDPNSGQRPATTVHRADLEYFNAVSAAYKEITGISKVGLNREPAGAFFQFGYFQYGVPSFSTQGWGLPEDGDDAAAEGADAAPAVAQPGRPGGPGGGRPGGRPGGGAAGGTRATGGGDASVDATLLAALEGSGTDAFVDWTAFDHPQLGAVEIGGFRPYALTNPPAAQAAELGAKHGEFAVRLAGMLPRVRIVDTNVVAHGGGVFTVEATIENSGYLPTALQHGIVSRAVRATSVQIQVAPEDVLTGDSKTASIRRIDGSGKREQLSWVIRGRPGAEVEIRVLAQKGGTDSATVTLR